MLVIKHQGAMSAGVGEGAAPQFSAGGSSRLPAGACCWTFNRRKLREEKGEILHQRFPPQPAE